MSSSFLIYVLNSLIDCTEDTGKRPSKTRQATEPCSGLKAERHNRYAGLVPMLMTEERTGRKEIRE